MAKDFNQQFRRGQGGIKEISVNTILSLKDIPALVLVDASAGPVLVTLFRAIGLGGKRLCIKKIDSSVNIVTVAAAVGENIDGNPTLQLPNQNDLGDMVSDNEDWELISNINAASVIPFEQATVTVT